MKTVILAGGFGSRISEESRLIPKPMIEIGGRPILWHIMKIYQHYGYNDFIICLGYKGYLIKEYFYNYFIHNSDITIDLKSNKTTIHKKASDDFKVTLVDTGVNTMTAGRLKLIRDYIKDEAFMLTYGDGLADINIKLLLEYHQRSKKIATITAIQPRGKFGVLEIDKSGIVDSFIEKPKSDGTWINGGFFVLEPEIFDYLPANSHNVMWEQEPIQKLTEQFELAAYCHKGFWKSMDILRDKVELEEYWVKGAPWKVWN